jgi:hypothetical protein
MNLEGDRPPIVGPLELDQFIRGMTVVLPIRTCSRTRVTHASEALHPLLFLPT